MRLTKKEDLAFVGIIGLFILLFFYFILGLSGALSALGIIILFILPTYLILSNFSLGEDEKIVFGFFVGVGIFSSIAYWLGLFISFRIAILVTFILLIAVAFLIRKYKK